MGCWICLGYFFRFTISIDLFVSPNIFESLLNVNPAHKFLFKVCTTSIAFSVRPVQISQQGYHSNVCHVALRFWLTLGRSLHYFMVVLLLTLKILFLLWMALNATLWHIFVEHTIIVILMGVTAKYSFATVPLTSPTECSSQIIVYKLF